MNTQQQDIEAVKHEVKWQAPELVELGVISNETKFGAGPLFDGSTNS